MQGHPIGHRAWEGYRSNLERVASTFGRLLGLRGKSVRRRLRWERKSSRKDGAECRPHQRGLNSGAGMRLQQPTALVAEAQSLQGGPITLEIFQRVVEPNFVSLEKAIQFLRVGKPNSWRNCASVRR